MMSPDVPKPRARDEMAQLDAVAEELASMVRSALPRSKPA